jgi:hypothetical protein
MVLEHQVLVQFLLVQLLVLLEHMLILLLHSVQLVLWLDVLNVQLLVIAKHVRMRPTYHTMLVQVFTHVQHA